MDQKPKSRVRRSGNINCEGGFVACPQKFFSQAGSKSSGAISERWLRPAPVLPKRNLRVRGHRRLKETSGSEVILELQRARNFLAKIIFSVIIISSLHHNGFVASFLKARRFYCCSYPVVDNLWIRILLVMMG